MQQHSKSIDQRDYLFVIDAFKSTTEDSKPWTAFVTIHHKRGIKTNEIAGMAVRDDQGERMHFKSVEEAFEGAEKLLKVFADLSVKF